MVKYMFNFHKILTNDPAYINVNNKHEKNLKEFHEYAEKLTLDSGKAVKKSGKASSYKRHLVRLIIGYEKEFKDEIDNLNEFESYLELKKLFLIKGFTEFNSRTSHFYSATLNCYFSYLISLQLDLEEEIDSKINSTLNNKVSKKEVYFEKSQLISKPTVRKRKVVVNNNPVYVRNLNEVFAAKEKNNWKCEFGSSHETFMNAKNSKPYIEAHHLIPMAAQDYFKNTIDFADNIVCLCPNCHRQIHYATSVKKKEMIDYLYNKRRKLYVAYGININNKLLYEFYDI